ncbi:response regulator [Cyanobacterium sp. DS4]|uniref:response regulator n=1 Tax=Cyanobacterium sp. DS4 TaxID=2878255 RepID=UPI002E81252A|nr:response regulator [Cyanobacterium sp. Dongsha4]WVL01515.1 response regulator [Cyanobacterium sp. Dongsha4]
MSKKIPLYILLSLQFAIQVIGIVGIVGYLSYRSGREAVNNLVEHLMNDTGDRIDQELDNYLQQAHQINQLNISALKSGVINLNNLDQLHRYLILQHQQIPNITSLLLGTEKGDFRTIHRVDGEEIKKGITMIKPTDLPLEAGISEITPTGNSLKLYTVDKNGNFDRYLETLHNFDVRKRPWYLDAVKSNQQGWTQPFQIGNTNILTINAYAPFYNSSQAIEGVFSVHLSLSQLNKFLKKLSTNQHGEIFILERNGLLIADSYHHTPFHYQIDNIPQPPQQENFKIKFERISAFDNKDNGILYPLAEKLKANKTNLDHIQHKQLFEIKFENQNYYSAVIPYQDSHGLDWLIIIAVPESQFLDTIKDNAYHTVFLSIIALIIAIISSIITSRKITRSLSDLSHIADNFNPKSEPPSLPLSYIEEISSFSDSLHHMMLNLSEADKFKREYTTKLEQEVKEKTEILVQAQKIANMGNWEYNVITQEVIWSEELYNIYEAQNIMPVPRPDQSIVKIHPDDIELYQDLVLKAVEKGQDFDLDLKIITTENNIRYIQTKGKPIFNPEGKIIKYIGIVLDVTERKQTEIKIARQQEMLEMMSNLGRIGAWEYNLINQKLSLSRMTKEIHELPLDCELDLDKAFDFYKEGENREQIRRAVQWGIERGFNWDLELEFITAKGREIWVRAIGNPEFKNGVCVRLFGSLQDITYRKKAEIQLYLSNQELIRATRLKDEFLANMSHELRTPLNAILGNSEILTEQVFGTLNARQLKAIATIESSATHLLTLINDILDIAKIEAGETTLDCSPTDMSSLCQSALTFLQQQAHKKNIQLVTDLPPELPYLLIDQRRIRQALINLLNNAVKFTPEGGKITLQVSEYQEREQDISPNFSDNVKNNPNIIKTFIHIAVIDTGIGIAPENTEKLFKPFIQIDSALNRKYTGTGLGLSLVKQIVELHGGNVGVSSELGKGSCFYFDLPSNYCNIPQSSIKEQEKFPIEDRMITPSVILLVDDEESNILTISDYLEAKGYKLLIAKNGLQAVQITKTQHPDLIIMDIQMPEMHGLEAIALIRQDEDIKDIPIIAATALTMEGDEQRCLNAGANSYMSKPLRLRELVDKIEALL